MLLKELELISQYVLSCLQNSKNLLAFSYGVDSTALFYILNDFGIKFDIAIVNYNIRDSSKIECENALKLAKEFNKKCFLKNVNLNSANFEHNARLIRYDFFDEICLKFNYDNLILAHQLNDMLEWFFMQFSKGAGLLELIGMKEIKKRKNYNLVRPLLTVSKSELLEFLHKRDLKYFVDESNFSLNYVRNKFRHNFSDNFLKEFKNGIVKSFEFLQQDLLVLEPKIFHIKNDFYIVKNDKNAIRGIDRVCKILGLVLSKAQKDEFQRQKHGVMSGLISFSFCQDRIFLCPISNKVMPKKIKEIYRILKIPKNIRSYIFEKDIDPNLIFDFKI